MTILTLGFPGGSEVKAFACNAGDLGLIPGSGRSPGEGNGNPLQYSCLRNPMDRGDWWPTVHRVAKSGTRLSDFTLLSLFSHWASQVVLVVKNPPVNVGEVTDSSLIPGLGRSPGGGHGNPFQYSCLENSIVRVAWWVTVHRVSKSWTRLKWLSTHSFSHWLERKYPL